MGRYSVEIGQPPTIQSYIIVVRKAEPDHHDRRVVDLVRSTGAKDTKRLCELYPCPTGGWTVVVYPSMEDDPDLLGPALVDGFHSINAAWSYATRIRPDINRRYKDRNEI